ncbi:MAG: HDOD domain-containing protein, partial [Motiliproteus sp.]|nr:HDOD domain-containing protein [Motiliproteus sp.]
SLAKLVPVIITDPVFTLHLIRLANQLNRNADTQANTVELAVSTLGLNRIRSLCQSLPVIKMNNASVPHKQYFHAIDNSYHAATQAVSLCRFPGDSVINETRIAALFYGVGHWALWRYAPQQMSEIKIGIYEDKKDVVLAENDVIGCTVQQISEGLVEAWGLSKLGVEALKHTTSPDTEMLDQLHRFAEEGESSFDEEQLRDIKQLLNANFYPVKLANWLALTVPYGWYKSKSRRLIEIISDFLKQPEDKTISQLHQNCVQSSREFHIDGLMNSAALMLLLPSKQVLNYRMESKAASRKKQAIEQPKQVAKSKPKTAPTVTQIADGFRSKEKFQELATQLLKKPDLYPTDREIYVDLVRGLRNGLGLSRVSIFEVDEQGTMSPVLQSGFSDNDPMRRFTLNLEVPSLFKKLSQKSLAVWMADHNREQIRSELPERFKACSNQKSFVLMSLARGGKTVAFIYCDHGSLENEMSQFFFKYFKYICGAANVCLGRR